MEYSISSSIMVSLIAMLPGIYDIAALGRDLRRELDDDLVRGAHGEVRGAGQPQLDAATSSAASPASCRGCIIAYYIWSPTTDSNPPSFVYAIFVVLFIFFNSFAINMILQYKRIGPWKNYLVGESTYILLSLVAKTILAWMVFSNTLIPT